MQVDTRVGASRRHRLASLPELSALLNIDETWIQAEAAAGRLSCRRLPMKDGHMTFFFDVDRAANEIADGAAMRMAKGSEGDHA